MITILSSYIRFKNYREILEELREKQNIMIEYIDKYKKRKNDLEYIYQIKENDITFEEIDKIKNDIAEYDTKIEATNILEYLTTKDIIRFNNYKGDFDLKIKEIKLKYKKSSKTIEDKYEEEKTIMNLQKPNIIVQTYYEPNKYIQPNPIQTIQLQPIQTYYEPDKYIQPIQTYYEPIQPTNIISSKSLDMSYQPAQTNNKFYNLS
jgi:hypothetical protein